MFHDASETVVYEHGDCAVTALLVMHAVKPALNIAQRRRLRPVDLATRAAIAHLRLRRRGRPCQALVWPRADARARFCAGDHGVLADLAR